MTDDKASLGEQALSKAAEIGISTQLNDVESLDVDIRTDPLKLVQGELNSVSVVGSGMVMQQDLRMEEMQLQTGAIAINPLSAAFGKIELTHPTAADAVVVLTESDINRAFNSEYVKGKLQGLPIHLNGQAVTVDTRQVEFSLPGNGKIALVAEIQLRETGETNRVAFTAMPQVSAGGQAVALEDVEFADGQDTSPEFTQALLDKSSELLDLRNFELGSMSLRLKTLEAATGKLTLQGEALIEQFPAA